MGEEQVFAGAQVVLVASVGPPGPDGSPPRGVAVFRFGDSSAQVPSCSLLPFLHLFLFPFPFALAGRSFIKL